MKVLVCLVVVAVSVVVSVTWAGADEVEPPPPGPIPLLGIDPAAALTPNNTDLSWISDGETSIEERHKVCSVTPSCTRAGGYCVDHHSECPTDGTLVSKACTGPCMCCMPCVLPDCKAKPCCSFAGGHCIKDAAHCPYGVIDRRGCKGPGCMCCLPSSYGFPWVYLTYPDGSGDAFVPFSIRSTWFEAQCICRKLGLNLYHPNNITAVAEYLHDNTNTTYYWLGAKGTGFEQKWLNGDVLPYAIPPWAPQRYYYDDGINSCVAIYTSYTDIFTWANSYNICKNFSKAYFISPLCG